MKGLLERLAAEYPDNFAINTTEGMYGYNPKAFEFQHAISDVSNPESDVRAIIQNLFEHKPSAKIFNISLEPIVEAYKGYPPAVNGGMIIISGTF